MPKKKPLNASSVIKKVSDPQQEKPSTSSKKGDEIDDIFASRKRKMDKQEKAVTSSTNGKLKKIKKEKRSLRETNTFNPDTKSKRRTNDGLIIYSEEELGINRQDADLAGNLSLIAVTSMTCVHGLCAPGRYLNVNGERGVKRILMEFTGSGADLKHRHAQYERVNMTFREMFEIHDV